MQIIHIPYCLDHILGYFVGPTYICKLKVLIVFFQGHVLSDGEPIQDVGFLLFSKSVDQKVWKKNASFDSSSDKCATWLMEMYMFEWRLDFSNIPVGINCQQSICATSTCISNRMIVHQ